MSNCGFIGLIGRPNVGKSTLMNQLIGQDISIATHKPQTTRNRILGIRTEEDQSQMIFVDTPGIHDSSTLLNKRIVEYAFQTLEDSDINLFLVEALRPRQEIQESDLKILQKIGDATKKTLLVINKIDQVDHKDILRSIELFQEHGPFAEIIPVSALKDSNLDRLLEVIRGYLPQNPFYFDSNQVTDSTERFLVSEFVREAAFHFLQQEIPYSTAVQVETFEEEESLIRIGCVIYVERDSQKGMVIGKQGAMLKKIGARSRRRMEGLLGNKVFLKLHVRVLKRWSERSQSLNQLGLT